MNLIECRCTWRAGGSTGEKINYAIEGTIDGRKLTNAYDSKDDAEGICEYIFTAATGGSLDNLLRRRLKKVAGEMRKR